MGIQARRDEHVYDPAVQGNKVAIGRLLPQGQLPKVREHLTRDTLQSAKEIGVHRRQYRRNHRSRDYSADKLV